MSDNMINTVSITIGTTMYGRFEDLPNTTSHILAEFIDNALQSYRDNRTLLENLEFFAGIRLVFANAGINLWVRLFIP